jgi:hypothetical protein
LSGCGVRLRLTKIPTCRPVSGLRTHVETYARTTIDKVSTFFRTIQCVVFFKKQRDKLEIGA